MELNELRHEVLLEYCEWLQEYIIYSTNIHNTSELFLRFVTEKILEGS